MPNAWPTIVSTVARRELPCIVRRSGRIKPARAIASSSARVIVAGEEKSLLAPRRAAMLRAVAMQETLSMRDGGAVVDSLVGRL